MTIASTACQTEIFHTITDIRENLKKLKNTKTVEYINKKSGAQTLMWAFSLCVFMTNVID